MVAALHQETFSRSPPHRTPYHGAGYDACLQAVLTFGGFGYAKEYHVERLLREVTVTRIAPITEQLIMCYIAEKVLDQPKSY
jgi:acyl-CoA dehydrogenase